MENGHIIIGAIAAAGLVTLGIIIHKKRSAPKPHGLTIPLTKRISGTVMQAPQSVRSGMMVGADGFYNAAAAQFSDQVSDGYLNATAGFSGDCPPGQKNCGTYCTPIDHHCNGSGALATQGHNRTVRLTNIRANI